MAKTQLSFDQFDNTTFKTFETVAAMAASTTLNVGDHVRTLGYTSIGDGGGNEYDIVAAATGTDDGGQYIDLATHQARGLFPDGTIKVMQFGAVGDGVTDDTAAFDSAYDVARTAGGKLFIPPGTYLGNFTFHGDAPVVGAGVRSTILKPASIASPCVEIYGEDGGDSDLGAYISHLSIVSTTANTGTGLQLGRLTIDTGCSNVTATKLEIKDFKYNILLQRAIMCRLTDIITRDGEYGIWGDSEKNVTTIHMDTVRSLTNDYGLYMQTGVLAVFTNCNFESNVYKNLWLYTSNTQGPSKWIFNGCWFEDLTGVSGTRHNIHLDMQDKTKQMGIQFNRCVISTPAGLTDIQADNANDVIFDRCSFSTTGFDSTRFAYASGNNSVKVKLIDCGTIQDSATESLYSSFPALTRVSGGVFGFLYEFTTLEGERFTNYESLSTASDLTSQQVRYIKTIVVDTSSGTVNINSLAGGYDGQRITFIKTSSSNNISLKHNGTGTQKLLLPASIDVSLTGYQGAVLECYNDNWYQVE